VLKVSISKSIGIPLLGLSTPKLRESSKRKASHSLDSLTKESCRRLVSSQLIGLGKIEEQMASSIRLDVVHQSFVCSRMRSMANVTMREGEKHDKTRSKEAI
jgi:hypothetical protein